MLDGLLPEGIATVFGHVNDGAEAVPREEALLIAGSVPQRAAEFSKGRECARKALARLGVFDVVLLAGPAREPLWPSGTVGSITHKAGFCAAAAGRRELFESIGIDAEVDDAITPDIAARACTSDELERLKVATWLEPLVGARAVFSAKESLYKLQFPITQRRLGFSDVAIELFPDGGFSATFLTDADAFTRGTTLRGRWLRRSGYIVTGLSLRA